MAYINQLLIVKCRFFGRLKICLCISFVVSQLNTQFAKAQSETFEKSVAVEEMVPTDFKTQKYFGYILPHTAKAKISGRFKGHQPSTITKTPVELDILSSVTDRIDEHGPFTLAFLKQSFGGFDSHEYIPHFFHIYHHKRLVMDERFEEANASITLTNFKIQKDESGHEIVWALTFGGHATVVLMPFDGSEDFFRRLDQFESHFSRKGSFADTPTISELQITPEISGKYQPQGLCFKRGPINILAFQSGDMESNNPSSARGMRFLGSRGAPIESKDQLLTNRLNGQMYRGHQPLSRITYRVESNSLHIDELKSVCSRTLTPFEKEWNPNTGRYESGYVNVLQCGSCIYAGQTKIISTDANRGFENGVYFGKTIQLDPTRTLSQQFANTGYQSRRQVEVGLNDVGLYEFSGEFHYDRQNLKNPIHVGFSVQPYNRDTSHQIQDLSTITDDSTVGYYASISRAQILLDEEDTVHATVIPLELTPNLLRELPAGSGPLTFFGEDSIVTVHRLVPAKVPEGKEETRYYMEGSYYSKRFGFVGNFYMSGTRHSIDGNRNTSDVPDNSSQDLQTWDLSYFSKVSQAEDHSRPFALRLCRRYSTEPTINRPGRIHVLTSDSPESRPQSIEWPPYAPFGVGADFDLKSDFLPFMQSGQVDWGQYNPFTRFIVFSAYEGSFLAGRHTGVSLEFYSSGIFSPDWSWEQNLNMPWFELLPE